jgi:hypothetical protein
MEDAADRNNGAREQNEHHLSRSIPTSAACLNFILRHDTDSKLWLEC